MDGSRTLPSFDDFDNPQVYSSVQASICSADALNFVIEFDTDTALAATDLSARSMENLLNVEHPTAKTRWINIWCPERQTDTIKVLANYYGFSPRLAGLMCCQPGSPVRAGVETSQDGLRATKPAPQKAELNSVDSHSTDMELHEKGIESEDDPTFVDLNHYNIVNEVWYFCSVDWGSKYLCIGYNSLSQIDAKSMNDDQAGDSIGNKPQGRRLWTWLIHCDDATIITIHENPFPRHQGALTTAQGNDLGLTRRNLVHVFRHLSKCREAQKKLQPITTFPIRTGLQNIDGTEITADDAPSLLFYYLFDDWHTTYSLVAKQEHQYGKELDRVRERMSKKPEIKHIQGLHHIGQQLAVLKKIYQSYGLIIDRILDRQKPVDLSNSTQLLQEDLGQNKSMLTAQTRAYAVPLSSAATVRFERLRDRINLYALSEIQDCLDEKESLVFLNFNLITLKQSAAVERLTRITILLAKVTILFMPVSLMTGYFSVQIPDLMNKYSSKTYWVAFAVIMTLSFIFLLVFGQLSGTVEGEAIYQSLTQIFYRKSRSKISARRAKRSSYKP